MTTDLEEKTYIVYWRNGSSCEVRGASIQQALSNAGYGAAALAAMDYYQLKGSGKDRTWDPVSREWV